MDDPGLEDTRQAFVQAISWEHKFLVVQSQQMQNRSVPVRNADTVLDRGKTQFVCRSVDRSPLDPATGQPAREGSLGVVTTIPPSRQLRNREAAHFDTPADQRRVEESASLQVVQQCRHRLIRSTAA